MTAPAESAFSSRRSALATACQSRKISSLIINSTLSIRYLSGFDCSTGWLAYTAGDFTLFVDSRYYESARAQLHTIAVREFISVPKSLPGAFGPRVKSIAFDPDSFTIAGFDKLKAALPSIAKWKSAPGLVEKIRIVKDASERTAIARACSIADRAFASILPAIRPGMTEKQLASALDIAMLSLGAEKPAFDTIVASGPNSAFPHYTPGRRKLRNGDFVVIDFGAFLNGYNSDITRTIHIGKPTSESIRIYNAVADAQQAAFRAIRNGVSAEIPDAAAREVLLLHGLEDYFVHSLGHGIGLEIHEAPRLSPKSPDTLITGMTFSNEPGVYIPGTGGVRIEDTVFLADAGPVNLTKTTKKLIVI